MNYNPETGLILSRVFDETFRISGIDWSELGEFSTTHNYSRNANLKLVNEVEKHLYYIVSGSAGCFSFRNGKECCVQLCYENQFFGDYVSMITRTPSIIETRTLEKTVLIKIPFEKLLKFYNTLDPIVSEKIGRMSAEYLLMLKEEQLLDLQLLTAEERYKKLVYRNPAVLQRTPLKYIASYLGITPESFSRIRRA